jgi:predicted Rossmann fold nucleotide-binding protein DprA/Smf involved in DNA uptake
VRIIIAGSRSFGGEAALQLVRESLRDAGWAGEASEVVSGGASGVDAAGEEWARRRGLPVSRFTARWDIHGRAAGPMRNRQMARYADALLAVWDGKSRGTLSMISEARAHGLKVFIKRIALGGGS